ncbi:hypothetical protein E8E12_004829 [Didymella heteroderae]|uniref:Uncharacterized protein n=1 Tax=Didymella heteroderae TaxID=1769908 RepID=A0A9P4WJ25_9PLEO|nr:hypothetical protein E8E12_004829 [Didymella heteroderae]
MEKKFDSWKESIKRSLGRKAGKDTALELRKHGKAERTQPQQQGVEQERTQQQDQKLQETEDLLGHAMKHGTWKTLKRSLGRRLGLHVRDELQEDGVDGKQQQHRHSLGDPPARLVQDVLSAGLNHEECATFAAPAAPEDFQAATPATTVPARYKVRRARLTGSEGRTRLAVRSNGAAQLHSGVVQNTPSTPRTLPPHRGHRDLGTTPTTPGYPHPLEIALPVPKGRRKFATWSPGRKLFWCCDQHASTSGAHSLLQCSKDLRPGTPQNESEGVHGKGAAEVVAARLEDGFRWPSSADPGLLEPTLFKPVEGVVAERQVGVEAGVERSQDEEEDDVDLLPSQSSSRIPGQKKAMLPAHDQTGAGAPEEAEEEVAEVAQHLRLGLGEEIAQAAAQHHTDAGAAADEHGQEKTEALPDDAMNEELNMQQIQASIASL